VSISTLRLSAIIVFVVLLTGSALTAMGGGADDSWQSGELTWRADYEKALRAPDGWLTLVGLDWLKPGENSFGSAADNRIVLKAPAAQHMGNVRLNGQALELLAPNGGFPKGLLVDGHAPANPQNLQSDSSEHPSKLTFATLLITVIHRGDRYALRIKDSQAPVRTNFHGLKWYAPNNAYRVQAKWIPYNPPKKDKVPTVLGTEVESMVPGAAEFTVDGQTVRLEPTVESLSDTELFFVLSDTTSKSTTYGAGRFLDADLPSHGLTQAGEVWLDFNRAHNPPCAYTPYATCPLPLPQNRLRVAIPAGEQRFHD
jgi:uncharacterized protein (DUF1684 family)